VVKCWLTGLVLGGLLFAAVGCGGDPKPAPLTEEEERQFEQQREQERKSERRERAE